MGHSSIATTNIYLHHLGTLADKTGLDRLNAAHPDRPAWPTDHSGAPPDHG